MPLKMMLDSGAFSVWNRGETIDLNEYIRFCKAHPNISYYVSLDVIPPKNTRLTEEVKNEICQQGWNNYIKMIRQLPMDQVIPVYHRGESLKWLEKYLDFGVEYIGLSPRVDRSARENKFRFVNSCRDMLTGSDGKMIVKTHGFAVTDHELMTYFPWYSVDSSTWTFAGAMGEIIVPKLSNDQWDFLSPPYRINTSVIASGRHSPTVHLLAIKEQRPETYKVIIRWIEENGLGLGSHSIVPSNDETKLKPKIEKWANRDKTEKLLINERGVTNCDQTRRWLNAVYFHKVNEALLIDSIYLAGHGAFPPTIQQIDYRLISFAEGEKAIKGGYDLMGSVDPMTFPSWAFDCKHPFSKGST